MQEETFEASWVSIVVNVVWIFAVTMYILNMSYPSYQKLVAGVIVVYISFPSLFRNKVKFKNGEAHLIASLKTHRVTVNEIRKIEYRVLRTTRRLNFLDKKDKKIATIYSAWPTKRYPEFLNTVTRLNPSIKLEGFPAKFSIFK